MELRIEGLTYEKIGQQLSVTRQAAWKMIDAELGRLAAESKDKAEELRALDLERTDFALRGLVGKVRRGSPPAAQAYLKALERRARLLKLDAPIRHEHSGPDGSPIPINDARTALAAAVAAAAQDAEPGSADPGPRKPS